MRGISWLAKELLASQEGVRSVECYNFYTHCGDLCSLGVILMNLNREDCMRSMEKQLALREPSRHLLED